jgi:hypothetical protein
VLVAAFGIASAGGCHRSSHFGGVIRLVGGVEGRDHIMTGGAGHYFPSAVFVW